MLHDFTNPNLTLKAGKTHHSYRLYGSVDQARSPLIINSPHSGVEYPDDFKYSCSLAELRKLEDSYVDELCEGALPQSIPLLTARMPRSYLDLNRSPHSIDPLQTSSGIVILETDQEQTYVREGSGLYATVSQLRKFSIFENSEDLPSERELNRRITTYYHPYHGKLRDLLLQTKEKFGVAFLIDMHSCDATGTIDIDRRDLRGQRPDIVISDNFNRTCDPEFSSLLKKEFEKYGLEVWHNNPFKGGYITESYGRPENGLHSIQIEITKKYMDENDFTKAQSFETMKSIISDVFEKASAFAGNYKTKDSIHIPALPEIIENQPAAG